MLFFERNDLLVLKILYILGYTANVENHSDDFEDLKAESNVKKSKILMDFDISWKIVLHTVYKIMNFWLNYHIPDAVWTKKATMAMLSLYEAKIHMLNKIVKQSQVWKKISEGLRDLCIQVKILYIILLKILVINTFPTIRKSVKLCCTLIQVQYPSN